MAAARSWRPRWVDTNGLLAPNFGQGPLPVSRPKPPSALRFSIACLRPVARIPSVPSRKPIDPAHEGHTSPFTLSMQQRRSRLTSALRKLCQRQDIVVGGFIAESFRIVLFRIIRDYGFWLLNLRWHGWYTCFQS